MAEIAAASGRPVSAEDFRHAELGLRESKAIVALLDARDQVISSLNAKAGVAPTDAEPTRAEEVEA